MYENYGTVHNRQKEAYIYTERRTPNTWAERFNDSTVYVQINHTKPGIFPLS
jgi:hypothetical protein